MNCLTKVHVCNRADKGMVFASLPSDGDDEQLVEIMWWTDTRGGVGWRLVDVAVGKSYQYTIRSDYMMCVVKVPALETEL